MIGFKILFLVAPLLAAPKGDKITFCETPADCGKAGVCIDWVCASAGDQAKVATLYSILVAPPLIDRPAPDATAQAQKLHDELVKGLTWSGFYDVLGSDKLPASALREGVSAAEMRRANWQASGIFRVVRIAVGAPGSAADGRKARIRVVEVERFATVDLPEGTLTLKADTVSRAATTFVNALVGHDTGIGGSLGSRIVGVTQVKPGVKEIAIIRADGTGFQVITADGNLNLMPTFGPGGVIGYMSYKSGNPDWVVDGEPFSTRPGLNAAGAWSPNGKYLALSVAEEGDSEIVLLHGKHGTDHARLTDHPAVDTSPTWSPKGKKLAFVSDRTGKPQIWVLPLRGGGLEQITKGGYNTSPDWSPNGQSLVYARQAGGGKFVLMRYDFETQETRQLTDGKLSAESPTFSPDGRYIAYTVKTDEGARLWVMAADGSNPRLVGGERSFLAPDWEQ